MFSDWLEEHNKLYDEEKLKKLTRGATYTPSFNAITLQKMSSDECKVAVKDFRKLGTSSQLQSPMTVEVSRTWCAIIYNMQVEDHEGYGWPIAAIEPMILNTKDRQRSHMLTWITVGMVSSCKELYHMLDQRVGGHESNKMSGHLLTYIHHTYMKHCNTISEKNSPFKAGMSCKELCSVVHGSLPLEMVSDPGMYSSETAEDFFMFGAKFMKSLFSVDEYRGLAVIESLTEVDTAEAIAGKDALIHVTDQCPTGSAFFTVDCDDAGRLDERLNKSDIVKFEARVILCVSVDKDKPHEFQGLRMARHGGGTTTGGGRVERRDRRG
ncbi:hypothetical protein ACHAXR_004368 [Thalassiosira sp. AJA248-18]